MWTAQNPTMSTRAKSTARNWSTSSTSMSWTLLYTELSQNRRHSKGNCLEITIPARLRFFFQDQNSLSCLVPWWSTVGDAAYAVEGQGAHRIMAVYTWRVDSKNRVHLAWSLVRGVLCNCALWKPDAHFENREKFVQGKFFSYPSPNLKFKSTGIFGLGRCVGGCFRGGLAYLRKNPAQRKNKSDFHSW